MQAEARSASASGRRCLWLSEQGGTLAFASGAKVRFVAASPEQIAARPVDGAGCRPLRDMHRALLEGAGKGCTSAADCIAVPGLRAPTEPQACGQYANRSTAASLEALADRWTRSCVSSGTPGSSCLVQPPVCRDGRCEETCPGVMLPPCPINCDLLSADSKCRRNGLVCHSRTGERCVCGEGGIVCSLPAPVAPGCSLWCVSAQPVRARAYDAAPPGD